MITVDELMLRLLAAFPEFGDEWLRYTASSLYGEDEPYNHVAKLASFLVNRVQASDTAGFDRLFGCLEDALRCASSSTRSLIIVGLIEDVQNVSLGNSVDLEVWDQWLGPLTRE